jgi:hypothetical protein
MSEANNNFEEVRRLLRLKRHEVPPPGYFHHFSGDVMSRIRAGELGEPVGFLENLQSGRPWLVSLLQIFDQRPGVIGGFATSLCVVLLMGVVMAERSDGLAPEMASASDGPGASAFPAAMPTDVAPGAAPLMAAEGSGMVISTNPIVSLRPAPALFGAQQNPLFQTASFMPAGQ